MLLVASKLKITFLATSSWKHTEALSNSNSMDNNKNKNAITVRPSAAAGVPLTVKGTSTRADVSITAGTPATTDMRARGGTSATARTPEK